jgi:type IV pilus assembly protein PilW
MKTLPHMHPRARAGGFSLIELMIGIALGLVILAALTAFFASTSANRHEIERTSRQIENGRYAIDVIRNDVHLAGFYAELQQQGATWQMPDPCVPGTPGGLNMANLGYAIPNTMPLPIVGYSSDAAAMPVCVTDRVPGTDVLVIRRLNTEPTAALGANPNYWYWQPSRCATDSTLTPWTVAQSGFALHDVNCFTVPNALAPVYRVRLQIIYLRTWSLSPAENPAIPTLVKLDLDTDPASNTTPSAGYPNFNVLPLVEGIRDLRFEYGIDSDGDGTPEVFKRCDTATPCTVAEWSNVLTVRAHVLAENLEDTVGYADTKVYDMGTASADHPNPVGPIGDKKKRHVYAAVISAPNRTGPRE